MPIAVVVSNPAIMPGYNSVDLDEAQSLARYCFSFTSTSGTFFFLLFFLLFCCHVMLSVNSCNRFIFIWTNNQSWSLGTGHLPDILFPGSKTEAFLKSSVSFRTIGLGTSRTQYLPEPGKEFEQEHTMPDPCQLDMRSETGFDFQQKPRGGTTFLFLF